MIESGIPALGGRTKKSSSLLPTSRLDAAARPKIVRTTLSAASASAINSSLPHPTGTRILSKSKISKSAPPSKILAHSRKPKSSSGSTIKESSGIALRPRPSTTNSSQISFQPRLNPGAPKPPLHPSNSVNSDVTKSLSLAQEMISIHKDREAQLLSQITLLQEAKSQLEQAKSKFQDQISDFERNSHAMAIKVNELEHSAELAEGKQTHENELRIRDLIHEYEVKAVSLEAKFKDDIASALTNCQNENQQLVLQERDTMKATLEQMESDFKETLERERKAHNAAIENVTNLSKQKEAAYQSNQRRLEAEVDQLQKDIRDAKISHELLVTELNDTKANLSQHQSDTASDFQSYKMQVKSLETEGKEKSATITQLENDLKASRDESSFAKNKLFQAEAIRRKLHDHIQELKGNIRVFCRVRPLLKDENAPVELNFPDLEEGSQQIQLITQNISGMPSDAEVPNKVHSFAFDKVYNPKSTNEQIFEDVSQLVQSALDGYNVCIFAYGQTGSGKTFTMSASSNGIIPLAINQIFETAESLKDIGWEYEYHGEFLEIYNERILDLLKSDDTERKFEIRHDSQKRSTTVIGLTSVALESAQHATYILEKASKNRSVAATLANERSSRSHSVFILRLIGFNKISGQKHVGVLNLIDLAGSERLSHSQVSGDRLKETLAINKSLSSLGDVICALGNAKDGSHVPYRNSKVSPLVFTSFPRS